MPMVAQQTADGKVVFLVEADDSKIDKSLKGVKKKIEDESKGWGDAVDKSFEKKMDSLIKKVGELGEAFGQFVVDFIIQGIDLAENLKEVDGMVETTFGQAGQAKITAWAKAASSQFGITEVQAKKYAASLGTVLKSQGATDAEAVKMAESLSGLAVDFGAAFQMDPDTAMQKIRSALTGSATALKGYVDMSATAMKQYAKSLGFDDFSSLTNEQKMQLRYQRLMEWANEGESPITGSFARSKGTVQNSTARAQSAIQNFQTGVGAEFLPFKEKLYSTSADFIEWLLGAPPAIEGSLENLQNWSKTLKGSTDERRKQLDEVALAQGRKIIDADMEADEYDPNMYDSFGQFMYIKLFSMWENAGGKEKEKIAAALKEMEPYINDIDAAEKKLAEYQEQIDYLNSITPEDAEAAGAAVAGALADGIASQQGAVSDSVNHILDEVNRLNLRGPVYRGYFYKPHATGLDYVPYDNYRAALHEGESVLTAAEAKVWRAMKYGVQPSGLNYDALGSTMRDNIKAGGNVYLDGQTVGRVISARQADSYRAMERSGFQQ